jgi:CBS domain-containing protein
MTRNRACCTQDTPLRDVARLMVEHNCGEIPVVECHDSLRPLGVVTDRDIVCRTVAEDTNPLSCPVLLERTGSNRHAGDVDECCRVME